MKTPLGVSRPSWKEKRQTRGSARARCAHAGRGTLARVHIGPKNRKGKQKVAKRAPRAGYICQGYAKRKGVRSRKRILNAMTARSKKRIKRPLFDQPKFEFQVTSKNVTVEGRRLKKKHLGSIPGTQRLIEGRNINLADAILRKRTPFPGATGKAEFPIQKLLQGERPQQPMGIMPVKECAKKQGRDLLGEKVRAPTMEHGMVPWESKAFRCTPRGAISTQSLSRA